MSNTQTRPIFIMSSERSGSNLLRTLLSNHSHISGPTPPQFLPVFSNLAPYYTPLSAKDQALTLMEDMLTLANHPYLAWDLVIDLEDTYQHYTPQVFLDFFTLFYEQKQISEGKQRFVCKENDIFNFAFHLTHYYERPKFLYLYRDPRDYAASFMNVPTGPKTPHRAAMLWKHEQEKCAALIKAFGLIVHPVQYEALIESPDTIMHDVLLFLEEPVEEACFQTQTVDNPAIIQNVAWKNVAKPIIKGNKGKYQSQFSTKQINLIETITCDQMRDLGYELDSQANWNRPFLFRSRDLLRNQLHQARQRKAHQETYRGINSRNKLIAQIKAQRRTEWLQRKRVKRKSS